MTLPVKIRFAYNIPELVSLVRLTIHYYIYFDLQTCKPLASEIDDKFNFQYPNLYFSV
jgi:hypothetical protein